MPFTSPRFLASALAVLLLPACARSFGPEADAGPDRGVPGPGPVDDGVASVRPSIVAVDPAPGAQDVPTTTPILIHFSSSMDPSVGTVGIKPGGIVLRAVNGSWLRDSQVAGDTDPEPDRPRVAVILDTPGLPASTELTVSVECDFQDQWGRERLEGCDDGATSALIYTFRTADPPSDDLEPPTIVGADPVEGQTDVSPRLDAVRLFFSEPMDASGALGATLSDGVTETVLTGTLDADARVASFPIPSSVIALDTSYSVRLDGGAFRDEAGNALDDAYLGDGALDFRTQATVLPTGDDCTAPLTRYEGTARPDSVRWVIAPGAYADNGGTDVCSTSRGADVVVQVVKTTPTLAEGGRLLRLDVASGSPAEVAFELRRRTCPPGTADDPDLLACQEGLAEGGGTTLDLPAGVYYVWVAGRAPGDFPGATVTVEELDAWPEGESCQAPYTEGSSVHRQGPGPSDPHVFEVRGSEVLDFDRDRVSFGDGEISCGTQQGPDAVFELVKAPGTALEIRATPFDIGASASRIHVEVSRGCDPLGPGYATLGCEAGVGAADVLELEVTDLGGGPVFVWLAAARRDRPFPGATLEVTELTVGPGESCETAIPVSGATATVVPGASTRSFGGGTCLDPEANIAWYAYTATENVVEVSADAGGPILLRDRAERRDLRCATDAAVPTAALVGEGETLCIGVPADSDITELTFR
ncbi:MAG: Ig-like domain-containing protein [Sandaracinaceae bacterium]